LNKEFTMIPPDKPFLVENSLRVVPQDDGKFLVSQNVRMGGVTKQISLILNESVSTKVAEEKIDEIFREFLTDSQEILFLPSHQYKLEDVPPSKRDLPLIPGEKRGLPPTPVEKRNLPPIPGEEKIRDLPPPPTTFPTILPVDKHLSPIAEQTEIKISSTNPFKNSNDAVINPDKTSKNLLTSEDFMAALDQNPSTLSSRENSPKETGKVFADEFYIADKLVATEKVVRADTVDSLREGLTAKIAYLESKRTNLKTEKNKESEIVVLDKQIKKLHDDLAKYEKHLNGATHGSVNMPRFAFRGLGRKTAKSEMAPVLTNLRMHTVKNAEGGTVSRVSRSGAVTDFRNGEVSLQELKDLKYLSSTSELSSSSQGEHKLTQLKELYLENGTSTNYLSVALLIKTKALVGYGPEALGVTPETIGETEFKKLQTLLNKIQSAVNLEDEIAGLSVAQKDILRPLVINEVKLNEVIAERSDFIMQLVLQDLQLHLKEKPHTGSDPILYARASLLNLNKPAIKESECVIHERTQGLDMKAIFDELAGGNDKGKEIVFDCKGKQQAFIDDEGRIHMPTDCGKGTANLRPAFFSICVQGESGDTLNVGMQRQINNETIEKLKSTYGKTDEFIRLQNSLATLSLNADIDPNKTVALINDFVQTNGGYLGVNCFGAKDRTGYVCALITHNIVAKLARKAIENKELEGPIYLDLEMIRIGHQLLKENGVAARVANDNAGHTTLKLTRFDLSLYNTGSAKGKMLRMSHGCNGLAMVILQRSKAFVGLSPLQVSSTPGQLYKDEYEAALPSITKKIRNIYKKAF